MFTTLIESRRPKERTLGGTVVSVLVHAAVITLGVYVTAQAGERPAEPEIVTTIPLWPATHPEQSHARPARRSSENAHGSVPAWKSAVLTAPVNLDVDLPPIDLAHELTHVDDFGGAHTPGDGSRRTGGADGGARPYFAFQVDKPALARDGNPPPRYPSPLEHARVDGEVLAQFVVDSTGRVDMRTFRILSSTNALFAASLEGVLPKWRFLPAEAAGRRVNQIVQLPVKFAVPPHE